MAGGINPATIEEIKARTDLRDLIASYGVSVKRAGGDYVACCPLHHEKTASFHIHNEQNYWHCFGCGETGDAFKFVMKQEGLTFVEAVKKLGAACGLAIEEKNDPQAALRKRLYALHAELSAFYRRCLVQAKEAAAARAYLESRRLSPELAERFAIGYAPEGAANILHWAKKNGFAPEELYASGVLRPPRYAGDAPYHLFSGRLMFTIRDRAGRAVAFSGRILDAAKSPRKYVNSPETVVFKKSNVLFALDQAAGNIVKAPRREALVCEGQIDVLRCHDSGFPTAVASLGTAFTSEHVRILKRVADSVLLVFDGDKAGCKAALRTGGEFLAAETPVRVVTLPPGEDPDSLLRDKGPEAFKACLDAAESVTRFQVRVLRAAEEHPDSIDAVTRVSRAVLEMLVQCPSAVIRESLLAEAAGLLNVPVSALKEDFGKVRKPVAKPPPAEDPNAFKADGGPSPFDEPLPDEAPIPPEEDAAAPANNPPPSRELAFCEFLFTNEHNADLARLLAANSVPELYAHPFTRRFTEAWLAEASSGADEIAALRGELEPAACAWLDRILLNGERSAASELDPPRILQDFLRQLWGAAVRRCQGALDAASSPENDRRRLEYSLLARTFEKAPWSRISPKMKPGTLVFPAEST